MTGSLMAEVLSNNLEAIQSSDIVRHTSEVAGVQLNLSLTYKIVGDG